MNLEEIKARERAATPGKWYVVPNDEGNYSVFTDVNGIPCKIGETYLRHDAEVAAHARTDIPALLAEVERLQNVVKIQRASCNLVEMAKAANIVDGIAAKDRQIATLKKALEEITRIKNDYFSQMQSYIKAFRLHQSALELAVPSDNDRECYLQQAQEQEAGK